MAATPRFVRPIHARRRLVACATATVTVIGMLVVAPAGTPSASAATANPTPAAGDRKNATRLTFPISASTQLSVDVATGNALLSDRLLMLPGVNGDLPVTLFYNSSVFGTSVHSEVTGSNGSGWGITGFDQHLVSNGDGSVTYFGPAGLSGVFTPNGSGGFNAPAQFQASLATVSGGGWTLTDHGSQTVLTFDAAGRLTQSADRNDNVTSYAYGGYNGPKSITSTRGPVAGRILTMTMNGVQLASMSQTSGSLSRSVSVGYSPNGHLASVTDTTGGITRFASAAGTDTGQIVTITNPAGKTTTLSFDADSRVTQVAQQNPDGAGTSFTRLAYPSSTQTLVADPTTDQNQAVSAVPHTTYDLTTDGSQLVASATDPDGNTRSANYTSLDDIETSTTASPGGGTTSLGYTANNGESLTSIASPGGAGYAAAYGDTGKAQYLPSSTTDDAGNTLQYTYDGQGNQLTAGQGTSGPQAKVTYNGDGTVATSTSPGAPSGVDTQYSYVPASEHDLSAITPPSGTGLGVRNFTWDGFGRLATASNGRGDTVTYSYDNADRVTLVHDSNGDSPDVSYQYDVNGRVKQRVDRYGTTSYSYDDLGHLISVSNSAGGGTISYSYDLNGDLATATTGLGTTTYGYDAAHMLTSMSYPQNGTTATTIFANDANGRRTDAWLQSNADHSSWAAHEHFVYDDSGRVTTAIGQTGPASAPTNVFDETLCYSYGAVAPSCPTTASADRANVQWMSDSVSGETNSYSYDSLGRLVKDVVTGRTNPRTYSYGYDDAGNRTSASVTGSSPTNQSLTFNAANQITSSGYGYDASGNQTATPDHSATYNAVGQQTSTTEGGVTTYDKYAADDQTELLSQSTAGGHVYHYVYGRADKYGDPELESIQDGAGDPRYILHDPSGQPVLLEINSTTTCLYLYDGLNNPTALVDNRDTLDLQESYDPYGTATRVDHAGPNGAYINPYYFHGGIEDTVTGQLKYGQRWYNPVTGTWTQQDKLNAPLDSANADRYSYAGDNPMNASDPTGRDVFSDIGSAFSDAFSSVESTSETVLSTVTGCITGMSIVTETGVAEYAAAFGPEASAFVYASGCVGGAVVENAAPGAMD